MSSIARLCALAAGLLIAAGLVLGTPCAASAQSATGSSARRVVIVLVDDVGLSDVTAPGLPGFQELARRGSTGLTTLPLQAPLWTADAYAILGSGVSVHGGTAPNWWAQGFETTEDVHGESAAQAYERTSGWPAPSGSILNPDITLLALSFSQGGVAVAPGALGQSVHAAGLRTAVVGNADGAAADTPNRTAVLVSMDASGAVDIGSVGSEVATADPAAPLGMRTDFDRLYSATTLALAGSNLVVVETGDLKRARTREASLPPDVMRTLRSAALRRTDAFVSRLVPLADKDTLLLVVGTSVSGTVADQSGSLAPIFAVGGGMVPGGILQSPTTHLVGLVALHDVAPTVIAHLGISATAPMAGQRITSRTAARPLTTLTGLLGGTVATHANRGRAIDVYVWFQVLLLLALALPVVQAWVLGARWRWTVVFALGTSALALLVLGVTGSRSLPVVLGIAALLAIGSAYALTLLRDPVRALLVLALSAIGLVAFDLLSGGMLARSSFLGYDIAVGARFYGIGNEVEGLLVGAGAVCAASLVALARERRRWALSVAALGSLTLVAMMAWPTLGADAGGTISAAVACGGTLYGLAGGRFTWKRVLMLAGATLAIAAAALLLANVTFAGSSESHVGRFLDRILHGDVGYVASVLTSKAAANLHLLLSGPWRWILAATAVAVISLVRRYRPQLTIARQHDTDLWYGLVGLLGGGVAVFVLNDSGVLALATLAPFVTIQVLAMISRAREA
jgi:hypothetical protein